MFNWLSRCWGEMGVTTRFERARIEFTYVNWNSPSDKSINILLDSFSGSNHEISPETAVRSFLLGFETDDNKSNPCFILKHIYLMDRAVSEQVALLAISSYHNGQILKTAPSEATSSPTVSKKFIVTYSKYVKEKAKIYLELNEKLMSSFSARKEYLKTANFLELKSAISHCTAIQLLIQQVSSSYGQIDRTFDIVQKVFGMLLSCYMYCYSVVSLSLNSLMKLCLKGQVPQEEVPLLSRLLQDYNKDYTKRFITFIDTNKEIEVFQTIKYTEFISIPERWLDFVHQLSSNPRVLDSVVNDSDEDIEQLPQSVSRSLTQSMRVRNKPRKMIKLVASDDSRTECKPFDVYTNLYSSEFNEDEFPEGVNIDATVELAIKQKTSRAFFDQKVSVK